MDDQIRRRREQHLMLIRLGIPYMDRMRRLAEDFVSIGPADIQAVAQRFLRPDTDWTLKVVPRAK